MRPFALAVVTAVLASCVSYDFAPVQPFTVVVNGQVIPAAGTAPLPRLMLAVDKSGSMAFDVNAEAPCAAPGCRTRWEDLTQAMDTFLTSSGTSAHLGMVPFPVDNTCGGASLGDITPRGVQLNVARDDDRSSLTATANAINATLAGITPAGGTPTGSTLRALAGYTPLVADGASARYVLLLTDGLPNCNSDFASSSLDCYCTNTQALQPANTCGSAAANQCLDEGGTVAAIAALEALGVKTIVVGFGPTTGSTANRQTLSAMAAAGGFERPCSVDADCGAGDTCSVPTFSPCGLPMTACSRPDFQASNASDLGRVLDAVRSSIVCSDPCVVTLETRPRDANWIAVKVNAGVVQPGPETWQYNEAPNQIQFVGAMCADIRRATLDDPLVIEVRAGSSF